MIDVVAFQGWSRNLRLTNGEVELLLTLEVGPRILSYTRAGSFNPLNIYADQAGQTGEANWRNRGGHRLWIAPESLTTTYHPDNAPVAWEQLGPRQVRLRPGPETAIGWQKEMDVTLAAHGSAVTIVHRVRRLGTTPAELALWALTVMAAGGVALMPQPELGEHPRDLLPNRKLIVWPYTDLSDPRWLLGRRFFRLRQDAKRGPTKIGLADTLGWCAYVVGGVCFIKRYGWDPTATFPDGGCNCETFTNSRMLEVESLGPLTTLAPGAAVEHVEHWELHPAPDGLAHQPDDALAAYFRALPGS